MALATKLCVSCLRDGAGDQTARSVEKIAFDTALLSPGADKILDKNLPHRNFIGNKFYRNRFSRLFLLVIFITVINR